MLAEHILYSTAIAILVGMVFLHYTGRDVSWIIILCAWAPDVDMLVSPVLRNLGFSIAFHGHRIAHGDFHNIAVMILFGIFMAFLLHPFGIRFFDSFIFSVIGFGAHLFEDAAVYKVGYAFFWPLSSQVTGLGFLTQMQDEEFYLNNFFGIANTDVLIIGLVFLLAAVLIRTHFEGKSWVRWYMPDKVYAKLVGKKPQANETKS